LFSTQTINQRTIRDSAGTLWLIAELDSRHVPGAIGIACLVFDSQAICRRYWKYPPDWISFTDERLLALMYVPRAQL
jgi:hypothetical protein